jgi:TrmH family RNA methyltransferase
VFLNCRGAQRNSALRDGRMKRPAVSARLQRYRPSLPLSYAFGISPTLELLAVCPELAEQVLLHGPEGGEGVAKLREMCSASGVPLEVSPRGIRQASARFFPVVGVFRKFSRPIRPDRDHVVLFRPQFGGNVGTVIRTMVGFGIEDLAMVRPAPDLMAPDVVRASMGAVFRLRWTEFEDLDAYRRAFGGHSLYCFTPDGDVSVEALAPRRPFSLVFGSEGAGLPAAVRTLGATVRIGHCSAIDSLNLGVAVGIALHRCSGCL